MAASVCSSNQHSALRLRVLKEQQQETGVGERERETTTTARTVCYKLPKHSTSARQNASPSELPSAQEKHTENKSERRRGVGTGGEERWVECESQSVSLHLSVHTNCQHECVSRQRRACLCLCVFVLQLCVLF